MGWRGAACTGKQGIGDYWLGVGPLSRLSKLPSIVQRRRPTHMPAQPCYHPAFNHHLAHGSHLHDVLELLVHDAQGELALGDLLNQLLLLVLLLIGAKK